MFCRDVLKADEIFKPVQAGDIVLYYMIPSRTIEFDHVRRKVRFEGKCPSCNSYETVAGAYPVFLNEQKPMKEGFFRTDIAFASGKSKFPLIIIGTEWKKLLVAQKFRGIDFEEIAD